MKKKVFPLMLALVFAFYPAATYAAGHDGDADQPNLNEGQVDPKADSQDRDKTKIGQKQEGGASGNAEHDEKASKKIHQNQKMKNNSNTDEENKEHPKKDKKDNNNKNTDDKKRKQNNKDAELDLEGSVRGKAEAQTKKDNDKYVVNAKVKISNNGKQDAERVKLKLQLPEKVQTTGYDYRDKYHDVKDDDLSIDLGSIKSDKTLTDTLKLYLKGKTDQTSEPMKATAETGDGTSKIDSQINLKAMEDEHHKKNKEKKDQGDDDEPNHDEHKKDQDNDGPHPNDGEKKDQDNDDEHHHDGNKKDQDNDDQHHHDEHKKDQDKDVHHHHNRHKKDQDDDDQQHNDGHKEDQGNKGNHHHGGQKKDQGNKGHHYHDGHKKNRGHDGSPHNNEHEKDQDNDSRHPNKGNKKDHDNESRNHNDGHKKPQGKHGPHNHGHKNHPSKDNQGDKHQKHPKHTKKQHHAKKKSDKRLDKKHVASKKSSQKTGHDGNKSKDQTDKKNNNHQSDPIRHVNVKNVPDIASSGYGAKLINQATSKYNISPALILAIIHQESNFNVNSVSNAGAVGLMQLMPDNCKAFGYSVRACMQPKNNIDAGASMIASSLKQYNGNVVKALAAYNAGAGSVAEYNGVPPYAETMQYVKIVPALMKQYEAMLQNDKINGKISRIQDNIHPDRGEYLAMNQDHANEKASDDPSNHHGPDKLNQRSYNSSVSDFDFDFHQQPDLDFSSLSHFDDSMPDSDVAGYDDNMPSFGFDNAFFDQFDVGFGEPSGGFPFFNLNGRQQPGTFNQPSILAVLQQSLSPQWMDLPQSVGAIV